MGTGKRKSGDPKVEPLHPAVDRLVRGVREFVRLGAGSHLEIPPEQIIGVLEAVHDGNDAVPGDPVTPEDFFLEALQEEVVQLKVNTFEEVELENGATEFRPLSDETWGKCLRLTIQRLQSEI